MCVYTEHFLFTVGSGLMTLLPWFVKLHLLPEAYHTRVEERLP